MAGCRRGRQFTSERLMPAIATCAAAAGTRKLLGLAASTFSMSASSRPICRTLRARYTISIFCCAISATGSGLEAFELEHGDPAGYRFEVVGPADIDPLDLMGRLLKRMRHALARQHLFEGELGLAIAGTEVRGRIDCDPIPRFGYQYLSSTGAR